MVNSRIWIQSCLCHGTVGRTKLTGKNKTDIKRNRDAKQSFPRRVTILIVPEAVCIAAILVGLLYASVYTWALNNTGLNCMCLLICGFLYPNKSQDVELWIWRVNSEVSNCRENREFLPLTPCCSKMNCIPSLADWIWGLCHFRHKSSS